MAANGTAAAQATAESAALRTQLGELRELVSAQAHHQTEAHAQQREALQIVGLSGELQGLFSTWQREFRSCPLVRVEGGGEWRRDRAWLYSQAWCDARAVGNVAMRAACWILGRKLLVAHARPQKAATGLMV